MITWLASYPRSGNTYLRVLLNQIFAQKTYSIYDDVKDIASDESTARVVGHVQLPRGFSEPKARAAKRRYLIKTHEPAPNDTDQAIYVIRDGRESMWSYKNYMRDYGYGDIKLRDFVLGDVDFGSWGSHVESWQPLHRPNTLLLRCEELVESPREAVEKIAGFLHLRKRTTRIHEFAELHKVNARIFRSGKRLAWTDHFSYRLHAEFWRRYGRIMEAYGYSKDVL